MVFLCFTPVRAAEDEDAAKAEGAVRDYEERIEEVAKEIESIRRELESLTKEMVEGDIGQAIVFLKGKASDWSDRGVSVKVDGKVVFGRPLSSAELDVLARGLPLELVELRLAAGSHKVGLSALGDKREMTASELPVKRAVVNSWIADTEGGTVTWAAE
jgi:hypothetical protein